MFLEIWREKCKPRFLFVEQTTLFKQFSTRSAPKVSQQPQIVQVFLAAIKACSASKDLVNGKRFHQDAMKSGQHTNLFVSTALVDMYAKCGSLVDAQRAFDSVHLPDAVLWNALILAYVGNGESELALQIFSKMQQQEHEPTARTFVAVFMACTSLCEKEDPNQTGGKPVKLEMLEKGMAVHAQAASFNFDSDIFVASALVNMYAKCGSLLDARTVFDRMASHDVIVWTALLLGYAETGEPELALKLYVTMSFEADSSVFTAVLIASAAVVNLGWGRAIHADICRCGGLEHDRGAVATSSLMDFYAKCGTMASAQQVFDSVSRKDIVVWNVLLAGYSSQGDVELVFQLFHSMQDGGMRPDGVTFLSVLSSCSHAGLVDKGKRCFSLISSRYGVVPGVQHYTCMVDLLGRANRVDEAVEMVKAMPVPPNAVTWRAVLSSCRIKKHAAVAQAAFESLSKLDEASSSYVLLSNTYI